MAPAKGGRRNDRHVKEATTATRSGRRPVGFAFSKFGRRLAAQHARRKAVKERGSRKRGRAGLAGGTRRVLDAKMLRAHRRREGVVHKQDGLITGRLGEAAVHKYWVEKLLGSSSVKWMNEDIESGLPYDITITEGDTIEYVEVKTTVIANKNWFYISRRELQFAAEKEDSLTIANVLLSKPDKASILFLKNPHKLLRQRDLNLALVMSMRCEELVGECME